MKSLAYIFQAMEARTLGLAPHYLTLYAAVLGIEARIVFEFGTGLSTRVILDALVETGGSLVSCSMESKEQVAAKHGVPPECQAVWRHLGPQRSCEVAAGLGAFAPFDLVLHDGSHAADVVEGDLRMVLPHMAQYGLILVHDTQHSYVGDAVRRGVRAALANKDVTLTTLPYGFGLSIARVEGNAHQRLVQTTREKVGSPHRTVLARVLGSQ